MFQSLSFFYSQIDKNSCLKEYNTLPLQSPLKEGIENGEKRGRKKGNLGSKHLGFKLIRPNKDKRLVIGCYIIICSY